MHRLGPVSGVRLYAPPGSSVHTSLALVLLKTELKPPAVDVQAAGP